MEKEVETAFDKELMYSYLVLFPIKLDEIITNMKTGWAGDIHQIRFIGDFRQWQDDAAYHQALQRLLCDLHI